MGRRPKPLPLKLPPGVVKNQSPVASQGRWSDTQNVRFVNGQAQKWGGWQALNLTPLIGIARGSMTWGDGAYRQLIAVGTHIKLYAVPNTDFGPLDITPQINTATGTDPISTVLNSATVTIAFPAHGAGVGQYIDVGPVAAVGGLTMFGSWLIAAVPSADAVQVTAGSNANATATGGGAGIALGIEIPPGLIDPTPGYGWGAGTWGAGTWGTPRPTTVIYATPRFWSFGHFGRVLIASYTGGGVYSWDPTVYPIVPAAVIAAAPTKAAGVIVTSDEIVIAFGTNFDPNTLSNNGTPNSLQWWNSAQGDYTNWDVTAVAGAAGAPSTVNNLTDGTAIIAAADLGIHVSLMWTDNALYALQYTGQQSVFDIQKVGTECGLLGPLSFCLAGTLAYWLGAGAFWYYDGSAVQRMSNSDDVLEWVMRQLRNRYSVKSVVWYNQRYDEVYFCFVDVNDTEPSFYVAFNRGQVTTQYTSNAAYRAGFWFNGTITRTSAATFEGTAAAPLLVGTDGFIYQHDLGVDALDASGNSTGIAWSLGADGIDVADGDTGIEVFGVAMDMQRQTGNISATFTMYDRTPASETMEDSQVISIGPSDNLVDLHIAGREMSFSLAGAAVVGADFRLGVPRLMQIPSGYRP